MPAAKRAVNQLLTIGQSLISRKLHKDEILEPVNAKKSLKDMNEGGTKKKRK